MEWIELSLFLVSLISGVRVATRLCRPVDDPPPLSSILGHHPPVHVLQLRLSHVSLDAIASSHTWSSSLSPSPGEHMPSLVVDPLSKVWRHYLYLYLLQQLVADGDFWRVSGISSREILEIIELHKLVGSIIART